MIELTDIRFNYSQSDFELTLEKLIINPGESAAIIGPSGCGKTTLLSLIAGILPSQSGQIRVNQINVHELTERERREFRVQSLGFVFQDFALIEYLNVYNNILHPYRINSKLKLNKDVKNRAKKLALEMGISQRLHHHVSATSQGEQQRAAICRALINQPTVILADEPTGNLDPHNKQAIIDILIKYVRTHQAILLIATHDHVLLDCFDRVIDLRGRCPC